MENQTEINKTTKRDLYNIDPRNIVVVEGFNSRIDFDLEELKESIRENGVKNPISVIPFKDEDGNEKYRLVDGERRYRATMALMAEGADIMRIPALFLSKSLKPDELLVEQLIRNEG
jgi:ParB family chromosome partitioning protein